MQLTFDLFSWWTFWIVKAGKLFIENGPVPSSVSVSQQTQNLEPVAHLNGMHSHCYQLHLCVSCYDTQKHLLWKRSLLSMMSSVCPHAVSQQQVLINIHTTKCSVTSGFHHSALTHIVLLERSSYLAAVNSILFPSTLKQLRRPKLTDAVRHYTGSDSPRSATQK